jgi:hypothetical protein
MASKTISFKNSTYYAASHAVDERLITKYLLPQLKKQGKIAKGSKGIELPVGTNEEPEYLAFSEARDLVLDYLIDKANLLTPDQNILKNTKSYAEFSDLASGFIKREVTTPRALATTVNPGRLTTLQDSKKSLAINDTSHFSSDQTIKDYNALYFRILQYSQSGNSAQILNRLFPGGIGAITDIKQVAFAQAIVANITQLHQAASVEKNPETRGFVVAREFSEILSNYPDLEGYRNFLGSSAIQRNLSQYVDAVANQAMGDDLTILEKFSQTQRDYGKKLNHYLLNESELTSQIFAALPPMSDADRRTITDQILRESVKNSLDSRGLDQIVGKLKLNQEDQTKIIHALKERGVDFSLDYHQDKIRFLTDSQYLTPAEKRLLNQGINPFLTTINPNSKLLIDKEQQILAAYNAKSINAGHQFVTLQEAYAHESKADNPDLLFLGGARDLLNRQRYFSSLTPRELARIRSTNFSRSISNTVSRLRDVQEKFVDGVFDLKDTVTGKKWLYAQWEKWDVIAASVTVPGTNIPLFRINSWVISQFESWKKAKTISLVSSSSKWTSSFGKFSHARIKDYQLGGYSLKGATFVGFNRAWSGFAYKASGKIIKGGSVFAGRTAQRLLIKIGGKALAKAGVELIATISGVFTAVGIILIAKDILDFAGGILKWGWEQLKKIFPTTEGAAAAVITGATVWIAGAWAAGTAYIVGLFAPVVIPVVVTIVAVFSIGFGSLYLFTHQGGDGFDMSIRLDGGIATLLTNSSTTIDCFKLVESGKPFPKNDAENGNAPTEGWSESETAIMKSAIETIKSKYGNFVEAICKGGDVNLWRDAHTSIGWGGWAMTGNDVRFYNLGVSSALYTLSHELGHIYATRIGGVSEFASMGFVIWDTITGTCKNNIYPAKPTSEWMCYGENFAELISWVISGHKSPPSNWAQWINNKIQGGGN